MRKIIIVCILFAAMLSVAIWEINFSTKLYTDIEGTLSLIEHRIYEDEFIATESALQLSDKLSDLWTSSREVALCFGNHNTIRLLDEKITSLIAMIQINQVEDARVTVRSAKALVKAITVDTHLTLANLL